MANIIQSQRPRQIISIQKPYRDQAILVRLSEESELLDYPLEDIEKRNNKATRNVRAISNNNNLRYQKQKLILQQQPSLSRSSSSIRHKYSLHLSPTNSNNTRQMLFPPFGSETPSISNNTTTTATAGQSQMSSPLQYPNYQSQYLSTPQSPNNHNNPPEQQFIFQKQKKNLHYSINHSSNCNNKLKSMLMSTTTEQPEKSLTDFLHRTDRHLNIAATIDRINLLTKQQQTQQSQQQQSPNQQLSHELLVQNPPLQGCKPTTNQNNFRNHSNSNSRRSPLTSFYQSGQDIRTECSDAVIQQDETTSKQKNLPYLEGLNYPFSKNHNNNCKTPIDSVEIPDGGNLTSDNSKQQLKVFSLTSTQFQLPQYNILQFCNSRYLDTIKQNKKQQLESISSPPNQYSKNLSSTPSQPFLDLNIPGMAYTNGNKANPNTPSHSLSQKSGFKSKENPFSKTFNKDNKHQTAIFENNLQDNVHNQRQTKQKLSEPSSSQAHPDQLRSTFFGHKKKQKLSGYWTGTAHFKLTQVTRDFTLNQIKHGLQTDGKFKPDGTSEGWRFGLQNSTKTDGLHFAELSQPKQINENSYINHHNSPKNSPNLENREFYKTISKEIPTDEDEEAERCHIEYVEKEFQKIFNSRFHKTEQIRKEDMVYNIKHLAILKYQREKKILEGSTNITDLLDYIKKKNEIQILIAQAKKIKTLEEIASVIENEIALQNNHITKIVSELLVKFDINLEEIEEEKNKQ